MSTKAVTLFAFCVASLPLCAPGQTVINVPPDAAPRSVSGDTILNLDVGGVLPGRFEAFGPSTVNVLGGPWGMTSTPLMVRQ